MKCGWKAREEHKKRFQSALDEISALNINKLWIYGYGFVYNYHNAHAIAFCCHHCQEPVLQNSENHDNSICIDDNDNDEELWFCMNCHHDDKHEQYV